MNNLWTLAGGGHAHPPAPRGRRLAPGPGLPGAAHGRSRCLGIHMCTAHQKRQRPAPRGPGRPQIGHLELEGKTNHSELWDAYLSSVAPAVAAEGRTGSAGTPSMFPPIQGAAKPPAPLPPQPPRPDPSGGSPAASPAPPPPTVRRTPQPACTRICLAAQPPPYRPRNPTGCAEPHMHLQIFSSAGLPPAGWLSLPPAPPPWPLLCAPHP